MNKQTISQAINGVEIGFSSIYTKDDVLQILNSIEGETAKSAINNVLKSSLEIIINNTIAHVRRQIINADFEAGNDYFDNDTAIFELSGNEISVYSIDADWDIIKREVKYFVDDQMHYMTDYVMENIIPTLMNFIDDTKEAEVEETLALIQSL